MSDDINDVRHTSTLAKFEEAVRSSDVAATPREAFIRELRSAPSLDDNGYICTKDVAIRAFDRSCGGVAQASGETEQDLRESNLSSLLREARQYVSDAYCNDDNEVHGHSKSLLDDIDQALAIPSTDRGGK